MSVIGLYKMNGLLYSFGAENGTGEVKVVLYSNVKNKETVSYLNAHSGVGHSPLQDELDGIM